MIVSSLTTSRPSLSATVYPPKRCARPPAVPLLTSQAAAAVANMGAREQPVEAPFQPQPAGAVAVARQARSPDAAGVISVPRRRPASPKPSCQRLATTGSGAAARQHLEECTGPSRAPIACSKTTVSAPPRRALGNAVPLLAGRLQVRHNQGLAAGGEG